MTADGGKNWIKKDSGTDKDLYGISFTGNSLFAVGEGGITIKYTVDTLGANVKDLVNMPEKKEEIQEEPPRPIEKDVWEIVRQPKWTVDFSDVYFADVNKGWAIGSDGLIAVTNDGGKTWEQQVSNTKKELTSIFFHDINNGWVCGEGGTLLYTEDGGNTWTAQKTGTVDGLRCIYFLDKQNGWITKDNGSILRTEDSGKTWKDNITGVTQSAFSDIYFKDANNGFAVTSTAQGKAIIIETKDGGKQWLTKLEGKERGQTFKRLQFLDSQIGYAMEPYQIMYATSDGGKTWEERKAWY